MSAAETDYFQKVGDATVTTLAAPGKALGATSLTVGSTTNYPTDTGVTISIRVVDASGELVAGTYTEWVGTVTSATSFGINATPVYGSDQVYPAGSTTQVYVGLSKYAHNKLIDGLREEHKQTGAHGAVTADSLTATGTVQGTTVIATGDIQHRSVSLETIRSETEFDYVASGCVLSGTGYGATLAWSLTSGVVYISGKRFTVASATGSVTASKDTYFDLLDPGSGTVATLVNTGGNIVNNNAASPALAASSVRMGIIVSGANIAAVASVNQGQENKVLPIASSVPYAVTDSLGNLICPRDPDRKILGYRRITTGFTTTSATFVQATGLSVPVIVPLGRKIKISAPARALYNLTANQYAFLSIWDGTVPSGTQLGETITFSGASSVGYGTTVSAITTPSTESKTYSIGLKCSSGTAGIDADATYPAAVLVELD
jgi:hypothetical protein